MKYHPHISYPGWGWIEPLFDMDAPLVTEMTARIIIQTFEQLQAENSALDLQRKSDQTSLRVTFDLCKDLENQVAALAEQNEKMRAVLMHIKLMGWARHMDERITAALTPDISTPAINRIKAEGMEEAADICDTQALEPECPERATYCAEAIRAKADELRGKS